MRRSRNLGRILLCLAIASGGQAGYAQTVKATVGTRPIGKADGVAIWVHPTDRSQSLIIGADPSKGLGTFDLRGELVEVVNFGGGGAGEVDVRYNFPLNGEKIPIVVSGNNKKNTIRIFRVNSATRLLEEITGTRAALGINAYGCCLYRSSKTEKYYVFVTSREGLIEQWELFDNGKGKVDARRVRAINILDGSQPGESPKTEACVADDELGWVYMAQEVECNIWRYGAEPDQGSQRKLMDHAKIGAKDNVEGLAVYHAGKGAGYLVASIQGSWKYKVYDRANDNRYIGTFDLTKADGTGAVQSHDCIEITHVNLGRGFTKGLLVTQNGNNEGGKHYQLVPWQSIAGLLDLKSDSSYDPD